MVSIENPSGSLRSIHPPFLDPGTKNVSGIRAKVGRILTIGEVTEITPIDRPVFWKTMTAIVEEITRMQITTILNRYRFEMRGYSTQELLDRWLPTYSLDWIRMAVLEALYRGRYKAISVEEILKTWHKRGSPTYNFTREFERLVCKNLPGGEIESDDPAVSIETPPPPVRGENETEEVFRPPIEFPPPRIERPVFDDPRKKMSDIGELFSKLTLTNETVIEDSEDNGNGQEANGAGGNEPGGPSIEQFTPLLDGSELYSKLKAVARSGYGDR